MYSSVCPSWLRVISKPSARPIVRATSFTVIGCPGAEVDCAARAGACHKRQESIDGIIDIHEVDKVLAVAADRRIGARHPSWRATSAS